MIRNHENKQEKTLAEKLKLVEKLFPKIGKARRRIADDKKS